MPPRSNVPIRICGSKTRSGCRTCKQRHVKCDEQKPVCSRCQKANRSCSYDFAQPVSTKSATSQALGPPTTVIWRYRNYFSPPVLNHTISPYGARGLSEVNAVKHFETHLGKELAGAFSNEVWCEILPRVAMHEPSIWYAMTAVGMLDASQRLGGAIDLSAAIRQYGKAMQELNNRIGNQADTCGQDVVLLSCILLAIFECLQDNMQSALRHIGCGMKLLIGWENEALHEPQESTITYLTRKSLLPTFLSLDTQAIQMGALEFRNNGNLPMADAQLHEFAHFTTIEEAHLSLNHIFNQMSHWTVWMEAGTQNGERPSEAWMMAESKRIRIQFARWDSAFSSLSRQPKPAPATYLLLAQRKVLQVFFRKQADGPDSELEWDNHTNVFREAIEDAETYLSFAAESHPSITLSTEDGHERLKPRRAMFTVSMDIVLSLFLVSTRCRNAKLRRRALTMLRAYNRKEGMWDSYFCSIIAGKIIDMEEQAALEDGFVPESARVYEIDVSLNQENVHALTFKRRIRDELDGHCIEASDTINLSY